ncbi:hypothetical protein Tco_0619002, partial [Tanacetum coccineum]
SCAFPGSDLAWSSVRTDIPTPDVTKDEATSPCSLSPLGAAASVPLSIRSESVVDEDLLSQKLNPFHNNKLYQ